MNRATLSIYLFSAVALISIGYAWGYLPEHTKFVTFKAKVEQAGSDQQAQMDKINRTNQEATKNAQTEYERGKADAASYYKSHPTKWLRHDCPSPLPIPAGDTQTAPGIPAEADVPPFTPEQCTDVALRLEAMLDLLRRSPTIQFE